MTQRISLLLCLTLLLSSAYSLNFFNKVGISNKTTQATCLDGSQYAFYIYKPDESMKPVNKLLIYFEETPFGWCVEQDLATTTEKCYKFITADNLIDFGSSINWAGSITFLDGILSPEGSGDFNTWTKVFIQSCDGGAYMGNRDPIVFKSRKLHFKGSVNTIETFKYLQAKGYLTGQAEVVIAGAMDGAIAAMQWAETLKEYTTAPVRVMADSAIHLNEYNRKNNQSVIQNRMRMLNKVFLNEQGGPNQACNSANQDAPWKCFFGIELYKYLTVPIMFTQSLYDGWSHEFILGLLCTQTGSLSDCKAEQKEWVEEYFENVSKVVRQVAVAPHVSMYAISCVCHEMTGFRWKNDIFEVPMNSGNHPCNLAERWINTDEKIVLIDEVTWPNNKPCANKLLSPSSNLLIDQ